MKKIILLTAILLSVNAFSQKGAQLPKINGITLNGNLISLPISNGKYSVIAMVYSRSAEDNLKTWLNPLYNDFIVKHKKAAIDVSENRDVNFVFVPMIGGLKKIVDEFKASTEKEFWPYIMDTEKSDMKAVQKQLGVTEVKEPYIYVVDDKGKILEVQSGRYSKSKMDKIDNALEGADE